MKKVVIAILMIALMVTNCRLGVFADASGQEITVTLNNNLLYFDVAPVIVDGRALVPLRVIFESLGADVAWDNDTQTASAVRKDTVVTIAINNNIMYLNGEPNLLDVPAKLVNGRTLVPVRAISEAFGCNVSWNGDNRCVSISTYTIDKDELLNKVECYVDKGEYRVALEMLGNALSVLPGDAELQYEYDSILIMYKSEICDLAIEEAESYIEDEDYAKALEILYNALEEVAFDAELSAKVSIVYDDFKNYVFEEAAKAYKKYGYTEAINLLNEYYQYFLEDEEFLEEYEYYQSYTPQHIHDLEWFSGREVTVSSEKDNLGNPHPFTITSGIENTYHLNGEYTKLHGCLFATEESKYVTHMFKYKHKAWIEIYGDDKLLYTGEIYLDEVPKDFDVDITGVNKLFIDFSWNEQDFGLAELYVQR